MTSDTAPVHLDASALEGLGITPPEVADAIAQTVKDRAGGRVWSAPKSHIQIPDGRFAMSTTAVSQDPPLMAVKSLLLNPANPDQGLPLSNALITLLHGQTGVPLATLDGNWVTALRTAGLSTVAARGLARADSGVVAFVGCGVQARAHLRAFAAEFPIIAIRALGRGAANRDALCDLAREMGLDATPCEEPRQALEGADLVVTSVTHALAMTPFLDARWLPPGSFAAITDLARPWMPEGLGAFVPLIIDDVEQEREMPSPMVPRDLVSGDLAGLVTGAVAGRDSPRQRTAFVFRGMAVGDLALAGLAYRRHGEHAAGGGGV
jgi:ornithine cyclodeaminase/alanine dehydrogenase